MGTPEESVGGAGASSSQAGLQLAQPKESDSSELSQLLERNAKLEQLHQLNAKIIEDDSARLSERLPNRRDVMKDVCIRCRSKAMSR